jgi:magnesium-transporting ATPase (P-type)
MGESDVLIDIIIIAMYVLLALTLGVSAWSAWNGVSTHQRRQSTRIGYTVAAAVVVLLLLTYVLGSTSPLRSNGQTFADPLWLRLADMFIYSSITLIIVCSVIVVIAKFRR